MQNSNRIDRILVILALLLLFVSGGLFYFDTWMWGGRISRGEQIGILSKRTGDVRMKFEGDVKWQRATKGQDVVYNDSIFSGPNSSAELQLGDSQMTVTENTLVVLRKDQNANFMNLAYGSLLGNLAKNEKLIIDTGSGKPIEMESNGRSSVVIKRVGNKTELEVLSGEAKVKVGGQTNHVTKSSRLVMDSLAPIKTEKVSLHIIQPLQSHVEYSTEPTRIPFAWKWSSGRPASADETYSLEFSTSPTFQEIHTKRKVVGRLTTSIGVNKTSSLFYRVRGPKGELSLPEKVNYVRVEVPQIVRPLAKSQYEFKKGALAQVDFEFTRPEQSTVWFQLAKDVDFKQILQNQNITELQSRHELPEGIYFLRARADYGEGHQSAWTSTVPFVVQPQPELLRLSQVPSDTKVIIPNRFYPTALYGAQPGRVKAYLARQGFLQKFFPFKAGSFDQLRLQFSERTGSGELLNQADLAWPKHKLGPGHYKYQYQASKQGWVTPPWSEPRQLEIAMEPPRPMGEVKYTPDGTDGAAQAEWNFTPLLFAKSYDVEVGSDPMLKRPTEMRVYSANVKSTLKGQNYWRVRARDADGKIISAFSPIYKLQQMVPQFLAKNEEKREPAQAPVEKSVTKIERKVEEEFVKNGWWVWVGGGENYVNTQQSIYGRGSFEDQHLKGPSEYVETGYLAQNGLGGVVSYKYTPGEINPTTDPVQGGNYVWSTMTLEGMWRNSTLWGWINRKVTYGVRAGVQQHQMPFAVLSSNADLAVKNNDMTNASLGALAEIQFNRWTYYWSGRYQYPLRSQVQGASQFEVTPTFAFDGSVGTSYNLSKQFKLGLFWYGQWHQFQFKYADSDVENEGSNSLFYSNVDLRLGVEF